MRVTDEQLTHEFKNFHRALCERFGYCHDEKDWRRDQVSLIEHIASLLPQKSGISNEQLTKLREQAEFNAVEGKPLWPALAALLAELEGARKSSLRPDELIAWECARCHYINTARHAVNCRQCLSNREEPTP